jgi:hypothetical protein
MYHSGIVRISEIIYTRCSGHWLEHRVCIVNELLEAVELVIIVAGIA